jgi:methyl-accepting chemotaxis protein
MFLSKEVKQQLEQAEQLKMQTQEYRSAFTAASASLREAQVEVDQMNMSAAKMDRGLTRVVDCARDTKEQQDGSNQKLQQLEKEIDSTRAQGATMQDAYEKQLSFAAQQSRALEELMDQSKHYTGVSKTSSELAAKGEDALQKVNNDLKELQGACNAISNLALQSAIEAGRMGDAGKGYVRSAEKIRLLAGDYSDTAASLQEDMKEALGVLREQSVQLHKFINLVKDNNKSLSRIASAAAANAAAPADTYQGQGEDFAEILWEIRQLQETMESCSRMQSSIMEEMENIGSCYMEQQDSTAKVDKLVGNMKRQLAKVNTIAAL